MPRDRAACDKAIRDAWKRERELVLMGKGTRDWTEEQQLEIIELGKVFDDDGIAYEGQHMKSAAAYPDHQGNPDNIQLLSVSEHLDAHKGSWQNTTNWYFDPQTFEYNDFGDADPIACKTIELSIPFAFEKKNSNHIIPKKDTKEKTKIDATSSERGLANKNDPNVYASISDYYRKKGFLERTWEGIRNSGRRAIKRVLDNPKESILIFLAFTGLIEDGYKLHKYYKSNRIPIPVDNKVASQPRITRNLEKDSIINTEKQMEITIQHSDDTQNEIEMQHQNNRSVNAENLNECSKLFIMGYTTRKPIEERHAILDSFVNEDGVEKARIHLQFLINTRSGMKNGIYKKAISNWQEDLDYLLKK